MNATADPYHLTGVFCAKVLDCNVNLSETIFWVALRLNHGNISKLIGAGIVRIFDEFSRFCGFGCLTGSESVILLCLTSSLLILGCFLLSVFLSFLGCFSGSGIDVDHWF